MGSKDKGGTRGFDCFRWANLIALPAAFLGLTSFITVAIFGFGKSQNSWMTDFYWYVAGGECFENGSDMYSHSCVGPILERLGWTGTLAGLSYPPQFGPIALLTALPPLVVSSWIFFGLCVAASCALVAITVRVERQTRDTMGLPVSHLWAVMLVFGSSGVWGAVWIGQVSLLLAPLYWFAFSALRLNRQILAGVLLALISVKPQLAVLPFLWVMLHGRFGALATAASCALAMSFLAFKVIGPVGAVNGWIEGVATYQSYPVNALGSNTIMGFPSLMAVAGVTVPVWFATALGAIAVVLLRMRSQVDPFSPVALAAILSIQMLVFSRPVDMPLLAPALALLWPTDQSRPAHYVLFAWAVAMFCFPQQLVTKGIPLDVAGHFRTLLLVILAIIFIGASVRGRPRLGRNKALSQASLDTGVPRKSIRQRG